MRDNIYFAGNPNKYQKAKMAKQIIEALEEVNNLFCREIIIKRDRPYDGQAWTDDGERGKTEVRGLTMRDIRDCLLLAFYDSSRPESDNIKCVDNLPLEQMSPLAISQNLCCWIEKYMGIFPNIPNRK